MEKAIKANEKNLNIDEQKYFDFVMNTGIINIIDWFNKNHFDYRGLIEKGLAIDATGLNVY